MYKEVYNSESDELEALNKVLEDLINFSSVYPNSSITDNESERHDGKIEVMFRSGYLTFTLNLYDRFRVDVKDIDKILVAQAAYEIHMKPSSDCGVTFVDISLF